MSEVEVTITSATEEKAPEKTESSERQGETVALMERVSELADELSTLECDLPSLDEIVDEETVDNLRYVAGQLDWLGDEFTEIADELETILEDEQD
jgi:hypothetical protein